MKPAKGRLEKLLTRLEFYTLYRDILNAIDEFTALHFAVTNPLPAMKHIHILSITQHA
jgi:hypothetical protein